MLKVVFVLAILAIIAFIVYWFIILSQTVWHITYAGIIAKEKKRQKKDKIMVIRECPGNDRMDGQEFNLSADEFFTGWKIVEIRAKSQILIETPRGQTITPAQAESLLKKLDEIIPTAKSGGASLTIRTDANSNGKVFVVVNYPVGARKFSEESTKKLRKTVKKLFVFWHAPGWPTKSSEINKMLVKQGITPNPVRPSKYKRRK